MRDFIKEIKPKKMSGEELFDLFNNNQKEIVDFVIKDAHRKKHAEVANEFYVKLNNKKVAKALKKIAKSEYGLDCGFAVVISNMFEKIHGMQDVQMDDEVKEIYIDIINKVLKSRIKEVNKKLQLDTEVIKELLIITPDVGYISDEKFVSFYSQRMLRKLYMLANSNDHEVGLTETKQVKQLFKKLFGKKLLDVIALHILLEKKEFVKGFNEKQTALWNLMTKFALETLEDLNKDEIVERLEYYCVLRKKAESNGRDGARRIQIAEINSEEYPKIAKAVKSLKKNGKENLVKFL